ncbi:hypothetical protein PAXRUDRAFT_245907 [Paxillus rubicundulus Ve08.2h10]|uniref:Unplaced genomic scaffold scaffold_1259, whole genome shotgun sequence n=1 Tax=Paxillus rubicundulus Ve08.2h10 TaxID=930991 RepID=A0A0D0D8U9_9AGAM|nr:hypothetical protein PAXRUDRAFT_245907 [Paxillus rubicundulus Ve08.2h10]
MMCKPRLRQELELAYRRVVCYLSDLLPPPLSWNRHPSPLFLTSFLDRPPRGPAKIFDQYHTGQHQIEYSRKTKSTCCGEHPANCTPYLDGTISVVWQLSRSGFSVQGSFPNNTIPSDMTLHVSTMGWVFHLQAFEYTTAPASVVAVIIFLSVCVWARY